MKLYYAKGACSLAVRIIIHEMSIACEYEAVNLRSKKTERGTDFLTINPKGAVPVLVLDNKEILTENVVILQYLAEKYHAEHLLPSVGDIKRYHVLEWLNFITTDLHKTCSPLFNPQLPEKVRNEIFIPLLKSKLDLVNNHLQHNKYLMGEQFTLADPYLFVILSWLTHFKLALSDWSHSSRYFKELLQRDSVRQALTEENLIGKNI